METFMEQLWPLTAWHWLAIGLLMFGIEMMTGTFDLLMVSLAAWATAAFAAFAPAAMATWQGQLVFFGIASVGLIILGRTVFAGLRGAVEEHPTLNKRMASLIGKRGLVASDFSAGQGKVKIGDTEWMAEAVDGADFAAGQTIIVESAESTVVKVRAA